MPAGRPPYRPWPNTLRVLSVMSDGKWHCRPTLRQRTGLQSNSVSPAIQRNYQRGRIAKRLNPHYRHGVPDDQWKKAGLQASVYVFQITDEGRAALEREKKLRAKLGFVAFDVL